MDVILHISLCIVVLINPNFTPVHLTNQSNAILELQLSVTDDNDAQAKIVKIWKGEQAKKDINFTIKTVQVKERGQEFIKTLSANKSVQALMFVGGEKGDASTALLHIEGDWYNFRLEGQTWGLNSINSDMGTTWAGGTDMLVRAVAYILTSEDPMLPVVENAGWATLNEEPEPEPFAELGESVHAAQAVYLDGSYMLHVNATDGDRLFNYADDSETLIDVTEKYTLTSASKISSWIDTNADGKLDLVSWNDGLKLYLQSSTGFVEQKLAITQQVKGDCHSISSLGQSKSGSQVILGTDAGPVLWNVSENTINAIAPMPADADLGKVGLCLVADFNGDNHPDILQLCRKNSLIYEGISVGKFKAPILIAISQEDDDFNAILGDFDADGLFDFFTVGPNQKTALWCNQGKFSFRNVFEMTGELTSKGAEDAISGATCDFNNDGRQDVVFFYDMGAPRVLFSRGFRSFGLANGMDMSSNNLLEESMEGSLAGCIADFNGDGCQDMVVIHASGNAHFLPISLQEETAGCVQVSSALKNSTPLRVNAWQDNRCLGVWNVDGGSQEAFFGQAEAGPLMLKWELPDGTKKEMEVIVENEPQRVVLK